MLRGKDGSRYRQDGQWTDDMQFVNQIRARSSLTRIINQMKEKSLPDWRLTGYYVSAVEAGKVSLEFKPEEFVVEEVELRTTGRTVAF